MRQYIIISYEGSSLSPSEIALIASQLKVIKSDITDAHASAMDEREVSSIVIRHAESKNATELAVI